MSSNNDSFRDFWQEISWNLLELWAFLKNRSCNKLLKIATEEQIVAEQQFGNVQSSFVISVFSPGAHSASKLSNLAFQRWEEADSNFILTLPCGGCCSFEARAAHNDNTRFCSPTVFCSTSERVYAGHDFPSGGESLLAGCSLWCHFPFPCPEHPDYIGWASFTMKSILAKLFLQYFSSFWKKIISLKGPLIWWKWPESTNTVAKLDRSHAHTRTHTHLKIHAGIILHSASDVLWVFK